MMKTDNDDGAGDIELMIMIIMMLLLINVMTSDHLPAPRCPQARLTSLVLGGMRHVQVHRNAWNGVICVWEEDSE